MKGGKAKEKNGDRPMRGLALVLIAAICLVVVYGVVITLRPVYWKIYAELSHKSAPTTASNKDLTEKLVSALLKEVGSSKSGRKEQPGSSSQAGSAQQAQPQQQQQPSADTAKGDQNTDAAKAEARKDQWEGDWKKAYEASTAKKNAEGAKDRKAKEDDLVKKHTIPLTKEAVQGLVGPENMILVTWANHHYRDFAVSWVYHVRQCNITSFIVGAMDDEILRELAKRKVNTFSMKSGLTTGDFGWGSKTFAKMGRKKINLIAMFLRLGVQVIISDVDVLWLRNPIPFFLRYPDADILTSTDHLVTTAGKEEVLEKYPDVGSAFNIGIMLFRNKSLPFVDKWIQKIEADDTIWDQNAFNDLVRQGQGFLPDDPNRYFQGYDRTLKVGVLPVPYFPSGHVFYTQRMHVKLGIKPYCVHATFQFSGTPGKRNRMREALLWDDDESYFRAKGGFLAYEPDIPKQLLATGGPRTGKMDINNTLGHFDLVNHQLKQLRQALALATTLGRTIILPEIWVGLDRYWAPHAGTLPGSEFDLPFKAPADHVLHLEGPWTATMAEAEFGPQIPFREHSFLNNSRLPPSTLSSAVFITTCKAGATGCADGARPATVEHNKVLLQENLESDKIKMALSSVASAPLIKFTNVERAFGNFSNPEDYRKFLNRVRLLGCTWCCVNMHPGHILYDLWWDIPHKDKVGRTFVKWEPIPGP